MWEGEGRAKGCIPDEPDDRDHKFMAHLSHDEVPKKVSWADHMLKYPFDQGNLGSCHDKETEVLTNSGFKLFSELNGTELLATVDPDTSNLIYEHPTKLVRFPYVG